jgi:predicted DNA-binding transcriptional regulator AlpA
MHDKTTRERNKHMPEPEFLRTDQAAHFMSMAPGTLYNLRSEGRAPRHIKRGRTVLYRKKDLIDWMEAQAVDT